MSYQEIPFADVVRWGLVDPDVAYEVARALAHEANELAYLREWAAA